MPVEVKICGITTPDSLQAAVGGGARYVGFVFYPRSPRAIAAPLAASLARLLPTGVRSVGLFVDPSDAQLDDVLGQVPLDLLQLHGQETPGRVAAIRARFHLPVMKTISIATSNDLAAASAYAAVADRLLFDAKPPANVTALPGGNGLVFDWNVLAGGHWSLPWMLSGGLNAGNIAEAVAISGAAELDVSSGVEDRPGHKDVRLIKEFLAVARTL